MPCRSCRGFKPRRCPMECLTLVMKQPCKFEHWNIRPWGASSVHLGQMTGRWQPVSALTLELLSRCRRARTMPGADCLPAKGASCQDNFTIRASLFAEVPPINTTRVTRHSNHCLSTTTKFNRGESISGRPGIVTHEPSAIFLNGSAQTIPLCRAQGSNALGNSPKVRTANVADHKHEGD